MMVRPSAQATKCPATKCPMQLSALPRATECPGPFVLYGHQVPSHTKINPMVVARTHRRSVEALKGKLAVMVVEIR